MLFFNPFVISSSRHHYCLSLYTGTNYPFLETADEQLSVQGLRRRGHRKEEERQDFVNSFSILFPQNSILGKTVVLGTQL